MLRIQVCQNEAAAKQYFTSSLDRGDYYMSDQELPGFWGGRGAELLGLSGRVDQKDFFKLTENRNPQTGNPLTARTKSNRRIGYEFNFNCAKGVSIEFSLNGADEIMKAAKSAVEFTMKEIERNAKCRVRKGRQSRDRLTGNLVWAAFTHLTSRPIDGIPDPHLHFHVFAFNSTFDHEEGCWKAAQIGDIKREAPYFESLFHSKLRENLENAGYTTVMRGKSVDLEYIPESCIDKFSRRTKQIEEESIRRGIDDPEQKAALGAKIRERKNKSLSSDELKRVWLARLSKQEADALAAREKPIARSNEMRESDLPGVTRDARKAMNSALEQVFERDSVVSEQRLLGIALQNVGPKTSSVSVHRALEELDLIRDDTSGRVLVTTREILREEQRMVAFAKEGRGKCVPFALNARPRGTTRLTEIQEKAFGELIGSYDRVTILRGAGGVGKSTLMQAFQSAVEKRGQQVFAYTTTNSSANGENGYTVARLLVDKAMQNELKGQVLWIDNAGMLGVRTMAKVFDLAQQNDARVVLSGDYKKHRPVERGGAFGILAKEAGLHSVSLRSIQRQRGALKAATASLEKGNAANGWHRLERMGAIHELPTEEVHKQLAIAYAKTIQRRQSALVLSPTRRERDRVSAAIRNELRKLGVLKGKDKMFASLRRVGLSEAERRDGKKIKRGHIVAFSRSTRGFRSGDRAKVYGTDIFGNVWIKGKVGPTILKRKHADRFDIFEKRKVKLARGDRVRFTRNGRTINGKHTVRSGSEYRVLSFVPLSGDLILDNGWIVKRGFGHLEHGYCHTSFAGQTKSADNVFIAQSRESLRPTSRQQFYSDLSRARVQVHIFTDDADGLREKLEKDTTQLTARDLKHRRITAAIEQRLAPGKDKEHEREPER